LIPQLPQTHHKPILEDDDAHEVVRKMNPALRDRLVDDLFLRLAACKDDDAGTDTTIRANKSRGGSVITHWKPSTAE
jgi:hypothetical protein